MHCGTDTGNNRRMPTPGEFYHGMIPGAGTSDAFDTTQYTKELSIGEVKLKTKRDGIDAVLV